MPITIETGVLDSLEGKVRTHEGRGLRLNLTIPDRGQVAALVLPSDFPTGTLHRLIGVSLDLLVQTSGDRVDCMVLPLQHQGSQATGSILGKLVAAVDQDGQAELDKLPIARRLKSGDRPEPHPLAEQLDRLLEQSDSEQESETQDAAWNRREWESAQEEEALRQATQEELDDPRLLED